MSTTADERCNRLVSTWSQAVRQRWAPHLEAVELAVDDLLYEPGVPLRHLYFPISAVVALVYVMEDGATTEFALVGPEGFVGFPLLIGGDSTPRRAVVQIGGLAWRVRAEVARTMLADIELARPMLRYVEALVTQMSQTAACNRHHAITQQLSRLLLMLLDRGAGSELPLTHERLARMLGVRREGVTTAAQALQRDGLIRCGRGHVSVLDRPGLEHRACECYGVVEREYRRLLGD